MTDTPKPIEVFLSYADEDELLRQGLEKQLVSRLGRIPVWCRGSVRVGTDKRQAVGEYLNRASIILLLTSSDFFNSEDCAFEMEHVLKRHQDGQVLMLPILLRAVSYAGTRLAHLRPLPNNGRPINEWENRDKAFFDVVTAICQAIENFLHPGAAPVTTARALLESPAGHAVLDASDITIGRASDNTHVINDPLVSRYHAVIHQDGQGHAISDLKSAHKTFVNGVPLAPGKPLILQQGDKVRVNTTTFEFSGGRLVPTIAAPSEAPTYLPPIPNGGASPAPNPPMYSTSEPWISVPPVPPIYRPQAVQQPLVQVVIERLREGNNRGLGVALIAIALCIILITVIVYGYGTKSGLPTTPTASNGTSSSLPTSPTASNGTSSSLPTNLLGSYQGQMNGFFMQGSTQTLDLSVLQEENGSIAGTLSIGNSKSAALNGSVESNGKVHFTTDPVAFYLDTSCIFTLDGQTSENGFGKTVMTGNFTAQYAVGGSCSGGTWKVTAS